jgi:hypothetical protein
MRYQLPLSQEVRIGHAHLAADVAVAAGRASQKWIVHHFCHKQKDMSSPLKRKRVMRPLVIGVILVAAVLAFYQIITRLTA